MASLKGSVLPLVAATVVVALALVGQLATADDYSLHQYCRELDSDMSDDAKSYENPKVAYETAMKKVKSLTSLISGERKHLADAWRAVTFDESCSGKSLLYVQTIYGCQPSADSALKHLNKDVRAYAKKCLTSDYMEEMFKKTKDSSGLDKLLSSEFLSAYRSRNPGESLHFGVGGGDNCCKPARAKEVLVEAIKKDFPQQAQQIRSNSEAHKFLKSHLYKPCASYVKHMESLMDGTKALEQYGTLKGDEFFGSLSQDFQDAIFRYKFCQFLEYSGERDDFSELIFGAF